MCHKLFAIEIHEKCFQITHKIIAIPVLEIHNQSVTYLICLALGKWIDEKQTFSQSCPFK